MDSKILEISFGAKDSELKGFEYRIPEGMEAKVKDGKVIIKLKESEDERIRKEIIESIKCNMSVVHKEQCLAWLEKLKEQKPAEWSEEDENKIESIKLLITMGKFVDTNTIRTIWKLLDSLRPQSHWKPSEEQMKALMLAIEGKCPPTSYMSRRLEDLYEVLANEYNVECKLENSDE